MAGCLVDLRMAPFSQLVAQDDRATRMLDCQCSCASSSSLAHALCPHHSFPSPAPVQQLYTQFAIPLPVVDAALAGQTFAQPAARSSPMPPPVKREPVELESPYDPFVYEHNSHHLVHVLDGDDGDGEMLLVDPAAAARCQPVLKGGKDSRRMRDMMGVFRVDPFMRSSGISLSVPTSSSRASPPQLVENAGDDVLETSWQVLLDRDDEDDDEDLELDDDFSTQFPAGDVTHALAGLVACPTRGIRVRPSPLRSPARDPHSFQRQTATNTNTPASDAFNPASLSHAPSQSQFLSFSFDAPDIAPMDRPSTASSTSSYAPSTLTPTPSPANADGSSTSGTAGSQTTATKKKAKKVKMHACDVCGKEFPRPSGLQTHMNVHSGAKRMSFRFCHILATRYIPSSTLPRVLFPPRSMSSPFPGLALVPAGPRLCRLLPYHLSLSASAFSDSFSSPDFERLQQWRVRIGRASLLLAA